MPHPWHGSGWDDHWGGWGEKSWSSPGKQRETRSWEERYTYLNGPRRQAHTLPVEDRVSLARAVVTRSQEGEADVLKLPWVKTMNWPADVIDAVLFIFCGISRKVLGGNRDSAVYCVVVVVVVVGVVLVAIHGTINMTIAVLYHGSLGRYTCGHLGPVQKRLLTI